MSLPEVHLAGEAVAALIDGELGRGARQRALDHVAHCAECRLAVNLQRQAKTALIDSGVPAVPGDLLCRLRSVPMTTDLGGPGPGQLAMADGELVWVPTGNPEPVASQAPARRPRTGRLGRPSRPRSYPVHRTRTVRLRRGLAGTLAGLAFGVVSAAAPLGSSGVSLQQPGVVDPNRQVVPASVGFGLNLPGRGSGADADRPGRAGYSRTQAPLVSASAGAIRPALVRPR